MTEPRVRGIVHERRNRWASQLRPRLLDRPVDWAETRSASDLRLWAPPRRVDLIVVDLADDVLGRLADFRAFHDLQPDARALILHPGGDEAELVAETARIIGATLCWSGFVAPPDVEAIVRRWVDLALEGR